VTETLFGEWNLSIATIELRGSLDIAVNSRKNVFLEFVIFLGSFGKIFVGIISCGWLPKILQMDTKIRRLLTADFKNPTF